MRHCHIYDFQALGRFTLRQYAMIAKSVQLQNLDRERELHAQAWLNMTVKDRIRKGKKEYPRFKDFNAFFNYAKYENEISARAKKKKAEPDSFEALLLRANMGNI